MSLQIFFLPSPHPNPFTNYYQPKKNKLLKSLDIAKKERRDAYDCAGSHGRRLQGAGVK